MAAVISFGMPVAMCERFPICATSDHVASFRAPIFPTIDTACMGLAPIEPSIALPVATS